VRRSSSVSGEERHGVGAISAREGRKKRKSSEEDRVRVKLYRRALLRRRDGEGEQAQGRAQVGGRRRHALRVCVAAARDRRPDVAG
jgi:hypothetical protein